MTETALDRSRQQPDLAGLRGIHPAVLTLVVGAMSGGPGPGLGAQLRRARLDADLTLEALSHLSGVSDRTISDIERGACAGPQRRTVELLVDALDLDDSAREAIRAAARAGRYHPARAVSGRPRRTPGRAAGSATGTATGTDR
jgi:DNA-binding XRE family transcriptional regulator